VNFETDVKFARKIGIELTFVTDTVFNELDRDPHHLGWKALTSAYKRIAELEGMPNANSIYCDPGCVEYPSPIIKSWRQAASWFEQATDIGKMLELTTTHPDQESGMGHIHVDCNIREAAIITADMIGRPYLTWIFATPMGSEYCKSMLSAIISDRKQFGARSWQEFSDFNYPLKDDTVIIINSKNKFNHFNKKSVLKTIDHNGEIIYKPLDWYGNIDYNLLQTKFAATPWRSELGTIEMRFFDSAQDWKQQSEHIAFAQRYVYKLLENSKRYTPAPCVWEKTTNKHLKSQLNQYRNNIDLCISDFKDLITKTLELPWDRYSKYIDDRLVPSFEYGKRH